MKQTANYQLPQFEAGDIVRASSFNDALSAIDTALKANADAAQSAASAAAGIGTTGRSCRIVTGTYYGDGQPSRTLTFGDTFVPLMIFFDFCSQYGYSPFVRPSNRADSYGVQLTLTWTAHGVSWTGADKAYEMYNASGGTYSYIAIGYDE